MEQSERNGTHRWHHRPAAGGQDVIVQCADQRWRAGERIPTSTVQANRAVVAVPDARLDRLAEIYHPKKVTPTSVEFVDVAGIGQATEVAHRQGLSAEFLGHIRNADALAIVLRCFTNEQVPTPAGGIDPVRDLDQLMAELALTDLATVDKRIDATTRKAKTGDKKLLVELDVLRRVRDHLNEGRSTSELALESADAAVLDELFLLTMKPRLYVANVSEDVLASAAELIDAMQAGGPRAETRAGEQGRVARPTDRAHGEGAEIVAVSARLEAELRDLSPDDAGEYLEALGLPRLGTDRVIQAGYRLLSLISFLTAGEDEVRAWTVTSGSKAPTAAGKITPTSSAASSAPRWCATTT